MENSEKPTVTEETLDKNNPTYWNDRRIIRNIDDYVRNFGMVKPTEIKFQIKAAERRLLKTAFPRDENPRSLAEHAIAQRLTLAQQAAPRHEVPLTKRFGITIKWMLEQEGSPAQKVALDFLNRNNAKDN